MKVQYTTDKSPAGAPSRPVRSRISSYSGTPVVPGSPQTASRNEMRMNGFSEDSLPRMLQAAGH
jgi:hypothetical protein